MLEIKNISKNYWYNRNELKVIDDISLTIDKHQFVVFLGPSGCGKTTLLKLIAGLIPPSRGHVYLDGEKIIKPGNNMGVVFQDSTLFPWLTVKKNILFGPKLLKMSTQDQDRILEHYLSLTQLKNYAEFYPNDLSGGMQQRVALARTLANNPSLLLMDEPFSSLDPQIREQMQTLVTSIYNNEKKTIILLPTTLVKQFCLPILFT